MFLFHNECIVLRALVELKVFKVMFDSGTNLLAESLWFQYRHQGHSAPINLIVSLSHHVKWQEALNKLPHWNNSIWQAWYRSGSGQTTLKIK